MRQRYRVVPPSVFYLPLACEHPIHISHLAAPTFFSLRRQNEYLLPTIEIPVKLGIRFDPLNICVGHKLAEMLGLSSFLMLLLDILQ
jgi:hypothetical protein